MSISRGYPAYNLVPLWDGMEFFCLTPPKKASTYGEVGGNTISMVFVGSRDLGGVAVLCVCTCIIHLHFLLEGGICFLRLCCNLALSVYIDGGSVRFVTLTRTVRSRFLPYLIMVLI
jgi:hypothetical protein